MLLHLGMVMFLFLFSAGETAMSHPRKTALSEITQKLNANQRRMVKKVGMSNKIRLFTNKKGKSFLIMTFPAILGKELMKFLISSLISLTIQQPVYTYRPLKCVRALLFIGCTTLIELYVTSLKSIKMSTKMLINCFSLILEQYPFHNNNIIINTFLEIFENKGIPFDFLESFLIHDNRLDSGKLLNEVQKLETEWSEFWKYKTVKSCLYCQLKLTSLTPITRRMEAIHQTECCKLPICASCYQGLTLQPLVQCKSCGTFLEFDKQNRKFVMESDLDTLHYAFERNFNHKIQNYTLTTRNDLPWVQPGTKEYGEYLKSEAERINQNYRMKRITLHQN